MRFRIGLVTGFGIGYVLGTKAGRERYAQIQSLWRQVAGSDPALQVKAEVREAATKAGHAIEEKASEGVAKVSGMVRGSADGGGNGAPNPT